MSRLESPRALIRTLDRAQQWAAGVNWSSLATAAIDLERTNAMLTPVEAEERGILRAVDELV
jgi:hypothetical protein